MKIYILESTKKGEFRLCTPDSYEKITLPYFDEWVKALKSNKYRQCTKQLCKPLNDKKLGYCCLGVLSKIQGRLLYNKGVKEYMDGYSTGNLDRTNPCYETLDHNGYLPDGCWVEKDDSRKYRLVDLNDHYNLSFKDIAKVIEILFKV